MSGDGTLRLFLGLGLPDEALDRVTAWSGAVARGHDVRLVPRESVHVTLAFLGSRPAGELPAIAGALREAADGVARFPLVATRWRETRSVGMLVLDDPTGNATRLATALHERLEALGVYRREARPWLAHLTVVRFRTPPRLRPALPGERTFVPSDAAAYISRLHPSGARYEVYESISLGG